MNLDALWKLGQSSGVKPEPLRSPLPTRSSGEEPDPELAWEQVDCLLCGGSDLEPVIESPDYLTGLGGKFRVVRCRRCGFAFTSPRPAAECMARFYPAGYAPHQSHRRGKSWRAALGRRLEHAVLRWSFDYPPQPAGPGAALLAALGRAAIRGRRRRAHWIPFRGEGRLLDFGCGRASFARRMVEHGWTVEGVDASAEVAAGVEREEGIRVHVGSLPHPDLAAGSFDAVTMWSALEHVDSPRAVVQAAHGVLRPGGLLVVYVPNLASWCFRAFRECWFGLELPRHLSHFTPATLTGLLESEGFRIRKLETIGRDGWLRKSARRAAEQGLLPRRLRACRRKPLALAVSRWTEMIGQAESILALADRE